MVKIYMIRHAEAEGNLYRRGQGQYDAYVTSRGLLQIDALAERFRNIQIDALYSSDLRRTIRTAEAVLRYHDISLVTVKGLREINMGAWEDKPWGELEYSHHDQIENFNSDPDNWRVEGAETFQALADRVTAAVMEIVRRHEGQSVAVFSHGMAIRTLLCVILGYKLEEVRRIPHSDNTGVSLLNYDEGVFTAEYLCDASHLTEETSTFAKQSWWKNNSSADKAGLRFCKMDLVKEKKLYLDCYVDAWRESNGTDEGFAPEPYYYRALEHVAANSAALAKAMAGDDMAGLVELDTARDAGPGVGWITLCYMLPERRGHSLAVQLIGYAVSLYRGLDRKKLRLHVSERNTRAIAFYERYGFKVIGKEQGIVSVLLLMEKPI